MSDSLMPFASNLFLPSFAISLSSQISSSFEGVATFFKTQKGRKTAFNWVWDSSKGGDGETYLVRFASDVLNFNIMESGYSTFSIQFVEVVE